MPYRTSHSLLSSDTARGPVATAPIWSKGFRPFFVLAALHAVLFLPIWLLGWTGHIDVSSYWVGPIWHGHEMIFGFTIAVIAGFLLTAVSNWTGEETAVGSPLLALALLWVAGRVVVGAGAVIPGAVVAAVDLAFIPALAFVIGRPLITTRNKRNVMFLMILAAFEVANLFMHLDALGVVSDVARPALMAGIDLTLFVILVIGGRIIPMFTRNATGDETIRKSPVVERAVLIGMLLLAFTTVAGVPASVTGSQAAVVGLLVLVRMRTWGTLGTLDQPILWVLHVGHAWVGVGLLLRAAGDFGFGVAATFSTHVLTVGAIGTLTLGMMSRVALGHTGRNLVVARSITIAYVLMTFAVVARAIVPLALPAHSYVAYVIGGVAFSLAFLLYLVEYLPILLAPRADRETAIFHAN